MAETDISKRGDTMDNQNESKNLFDTRKKKMLYGIVAVSIPVNFLLLYSKVGPLGYGWLAFACVVFGAIVGLAIIKLIFWHANRP